MPFPSVNAAPTVHFTLIRSSGHRQNIAPTTTALEELDDCSKLLAEVSTGKGVPLGSLVFPSTALLRVRYEYCTVSPSAVPGGKCQDDSQRAPLRLLGRTSFSITHADYFGLANDHHETCRGYWKGSPRATEAYIGRGTSQAAK